MLFRNREIRMRLARTNETPTDTDVRVYDPEEIADLAKDFVQHTVKVATGGALIIIAALLIRDTALEVVKAGFR